MHESRRQALRRLVLGGVGTASSGIWGEALLARALAWSEHAGHGRSLPVSSGPWTPAVFDAHQRETVATLCELIIPETDTPGARAARVDEYIDTVLADAHPAERESFLRGLAWLDRRSRELFGEPFTGASEQEQTALLTILSSPDNAAAADQLGVELFHTVKGMTITGYYTSELGMATELGDDGNLFFWEYAGCEHPEHQA